MKRSWSAAALLLAACFLFLDQSSSAQRASSLQIRATSLADVRQWDAYVRERERSGELRVRSVDRDPALPERTIERLQQFHRGVPIWGAQVVRDSDQGITHSLFGNLTPDLALSTDAALTVDTARTALLAAGGDGATLLDAPALMILRRNSGEHRLTYMGIVARLASVSRVFIDADSGIEVERHSEIHTQSAVGTGRGALGDTKKLSVLQITGGSFVADDQLRPPVLRTYDMRGLWARALAVLDGAPLLASDRATDADNNWTDVAVVDAHSHVGWTYDYYFKRHGRSGLDDRNRPIYSMINGVSQFGALTLPDDLFDLAVNAFWCDLCGPNEVGMMYFGNGIPPQFSLGGQSIGYLAGSLDIVAHELTHAVISSSSRLIDGNEPGALNEAIADIMGTSVEFFFQTPGTGLRQADYLIGEDAFRGVTTSLNGIRSLSNPQAYEQLPGLPSPDNYSMRYTGDEDDGGVHVNAGIAGHAFYLAVEGGTNRTSGLAVQGVGAANREQIEKAFYRGFIFLIPPNSTFSIARAATIQAARDLYGAGSAAERAVTQAWTAVGVF